MCVLNIVMSSDIVTVMSLTLHVTSVSCGIPTCMVHVSTYVRTYVCERVGLSVVSSYWVIFLWCKYVRIESLSSVSTI